MADGWMNWQMDEWMDESQNNDQIGRWMNDWLAGCLCRWLDERCVDELAD